MDKKKFRFECNENCPSQVLWVANSLGMAGYLSVQTAAAAAGHYVT